MTYHQILQAIGLGVVLVFMIGPVFFALIQTSIKSGFLSGVVMAIGIACSDVLYITLSYVGLSDFIMSHIEVFKIIGGIIFIGFGIYNLLKKHVTITTSIQVEGKDLFKTFVKGFLINFSNPFVIVFWIITVGAVTSEMRGQLHFVPLYFTITIATVLVGDILKSLLAHRLSKWVNPKALLWIYRVVGIILILVGFRVFMFNPEAHSI